ncbi:MAG: ABC transporter permease, partial [Terriglobales bacterium]
MRLKIWRRARHEREIAEELAAHAALRAEASQAAGLPPDAAARAAARRLGSDLALRERTRLASMSRAGVAAEELARDLRLAGRGLRRRPGFTLLAVLTLGLGIGATTAMFSVVRAVLVDTLPFPHPEQLVMVLSRGATVGDATMNFDNVPRTAFDALRQSRLFASVGYSGYVDAGGTIYVGGVVVPGGVMRASRDLFTTLDVHMELGHGFRGSQPQAIVSDQFWRQHLGGDAAALGRPLRVNDQLYALAGVLPPGEAWPTGLSAWLNTIPALGTGMVVARLRANQPPAEALKQAEAVVAAIGARAHAPWRPNTLVAEPLERNLATPEASTALWILLSAAACLLLIAALNTANLLLARGLGREAEFAIRRALGATRWRLARLGPAAVPRLGAVRLDAPALAFAAAVALASGLGCALAPALRLSSTRPSAGASRL